MKNSLEGIWIPDSNHQDGVCDVDSDWFHADELESILKLYPQKYRRKISIPADLHFETKECFHHYIFGGGIPYHGVIAKELLKSFSMILFKREP